MRLYGAASCKVGKEIEAHHMNPGTDNVSGCARQTEEDVPPAGGASSSVCLSLYEYCGELFHADIAVMDCDGRGKFANPVLLFLQRCYFFVP